MNSRAGLGNPRRATARRLIVSRIRRIECQLGQKLLDSDGLRQSARAARGRAYHVQTSSNSSGQPMDLLCNRRIVSISSDQWSLAAGGGTKLVTTWMVSVSLMWSRSRAAFLGPIPGKS
jgi:hypothetical protein